MGRGVVFQTPIVRRLSEEDARLLLETYSELLDEYNADRLDRERVNNIKLRNNVSAKVGMIRENLRKLT